MFEQLRFKLQRQKILTDFNIKNKMFYCGTYKGYKYSVTIDRYCLNETYADRDYWYQCVFKDNNRNYICSAFGDTEREAFILAEESLNLYLLERK